MFTHCRTMLTPFNTDTVERRACLRTSECSWMIVDTRPTTLSGVSLPGLSARVSFWRSTWCWIGRSIIATIAASKGARAQSQFEGPKVTLYNSCDEDRITPEPVRRETLRAIINARKRHHNFPILEARESRVSHSLWVPPCAVGEEEIGQFILTSHRRYCQSSRPISEITPAYPHLKSSNQEHFEFDWKQVPQRCLDERFWWEWLSVGTEEKVREL